MENNLNEKIIKTIYHKLQDDEIKKKLIDKFVFKNEPKENYIDFEDFEIDLENSFQKFNYYTITNDSTFEFEIKFKHKEERMLLLEMDFLPTQRYGKEEYKRFAENPTFKFQFQIKPEYFLNFLENYIDF